MGNSANEKASPEGEAVRRELDRRLLAEARRRESGWEMRRFLILGLVAVLLTFAGFQYGHPEYAVAGIALGAVAVFLAFVR